MTRAVISVLILTCGIGFLCYVVGYKNGCETGYRNAEAKAAKEITDMGSICEKEINKIKDLCLSELGRR